MSLPDKLREIVLDTSRDSTLLEAVDTLESQAARILELEGALRCILETETEEDAEHDDKTPCPYCIARRALGGGA